MRGAERHLLGLGEEVVRIAVKHHTPHQPHRHVFLGDQLGRIEHVIRLRIRKFLIEHLQTQFPFRIGATDDRFVQVTTVVIVIRSLELERLVPQRRLHAELRFPVEFAECNLAPGIDQLEGVDAETFDGAQGTRDCAVGHRPHQHMRGLGHERSPVPEGVVRTARLWIGTVGLHLHGVH